MTFGSVAMFLGVAGGALAFAYWVRWFIRLLSALISSSDLDAVSPRSMAVVSLQLVGLASLWFGPIVLVGFLHDGAPLGQVLVFGVSAAAILLAANMLWAQLLGMSLRHRIRGQARTAPGR